jgi:CheY-specific phosphatase CheX
MNAVAQDEIVRLTETIWLSTVNLLPTTMTDGATTEPGEAPAAQMLSGIVHITGEHSATVAVQVPHALASRLATSMFALDGSEPSAEDLQDALGEIANITGGNIKALLEGECSLTLPVVIEGSSYRVRVPGGEVVNRVQFECDGLPFVVSVIARKA